MFVTVAAGPFLFGCVEPWSAGLLQASIFALTVALVLTRPFRWGDVPWHAWGLLAVAGLAAVQAMHPAHSVGAAVGPHTSSGWATAATARLWVAYACLAWAVSALAGSRRQAQRTAWALFWVGTAVAVLGIIQQESDARSFYGLRPFPEEPFWTFGPYFYKNHAGGLLVMSFALGVGLLLSRWSSRSGFRRAARHAASPRRHSRRGRGRTGFRVRQALLAGVLAVQGTAIWLCQSRGAIHALAVAGVAAGVLAAVGFARPRARNRWFVAIMVAVASYAALAVAFPKLADYMETGRPIGSFAERVRIWEATWPMVKARPVWGYGMGAYAYAFPSYQAAMVPPLEGEVRNAHSEWLELLVGGGIVGCALLGLGLLLQMVCMVRAWWAWDEPGMRPLFGGAFAAAVTFIFHGSADLNLVSPANAAVFLLAMGLIFPPRPRGEAAEAPLRPGIASRSPLRAAAGAAGRAALLALALWGCWSTARLLGGWYCAHRAAEADLAGRVEWYGKALHWTPGHPGYEEELGVALLWLGEENPAARRIFARQALAAATRGLQVTPDHAGLAEVAGVALAWTGREAAGRRFIAVAEALRPWGRAPAPRGSPAPPRKAPGRR